MDNVVPVHELRTRKSKWFYDKILKQKATKNKAVNKWSLVFNEEIRCEDFYHNKLKPVFDVKIAEFNYKLFSNILATGRNLYKWGKIQYQSCIYCDHGTHDGRHLLFECPSLHNLWNIISETLNVQINWKAIVIGVESLPGVNFCISLINYIIYKKYLVDKDKVNENEICHIRKYVKKELEFRLESLRMCAICNLDITIKLRCICDNLTMNG